MKKHHIRNSVFNLINQVSMILAKKKRILAVLMAAVVVTGLSSCLKNNGNTKPEPYAMAFFANVATPQYKVSIFQNNQDLTRGNGLEFGKQASGQIKPGPLQKFDFKRLGSDTLLATYTATMDTLRYYSTFIYGTQATGVKAYNFREDFSDISATKAHVRFFNMVEGAEPVTFFIGANAQPSGTDRRYEDFTTGYFNSFSKIDPTTADVTVKDAAGTVLATYNSMPLTTAGGVYTIMYIGTKGDAGNRKPQIVPFGH